MAEKITETAIKALAPPTSGNRITYDSEVTGFGVRVTSKGSKAFILNYRAGGNERRITIGSYPDWTVVNARKHAKILKQRIDLGEDPMADRHAGRAAPTMNELADRFVAEHLEKKRSKTQVGYEAILRLHVRPALGKMKVADVRHADIERLHAKIARNGPYQANRTVAVLSKMMSLAVKWEMRNDNPVIGIERAPESRRERFLSPAEIARLGEALAAHPERTSANAVRLLLLTGARKGETLSATWSQIDLEAGAWTKPAASTKGKKDHRVPLSAPALQLLAKMKALADRENERRGKDKLPPIECLFPGTDAKPLTDIKHFWASVCRKADITGVRVHDLRHTHASILVSLGLSLPIIGALLGHTQAQTTHRYAHLMDDPLRAATERLGAIVTGAELLPIAAGRAR